MARRTQKSAQSVYKSQYGLYNRPKNLSGWARLGIAMFPSKSYVVVDRRAVVGRQWDGRMERENFSLRIRKSRGSDTTPVLVPWLHPTVKISASECVTLTAQCDQLFTRWKGRESWPGNRWIFISSPGGKFAAPCLSEGTADSQTANLRNTPIL
jgi:hypothetical protein